MPDSTDLPFHSGELDAQMRFNEAWDEHRSRKLGQIIGTRLDADMTRFVESLNFFFLATADNEGHCDCSYKGSDPGPDGRPSPAVRVRNPSLLLFPDYAGNRVFNSLGNILINPYVGMIFIDFTAQRRLRINGRAEVIESRNEWAHDWPEAPRAVLVDMEQVYWNCSRRIPRQP